MRNNKKSSTLGLFKIDSFSAFGDYVRNCPEKIKEIVVGAAMWQECDRLVSQVNMSHLMQKSSSKDFFSAKLSLSFYGEDCLNDSEFQNSSIILALNNISDPRNLGAIVRSAAYFGVKYIILPKNRQVLLTQVVVDTAQAGLSCVQCICVTNLGRTLLELKKAGHWVLGMDMDGQEAANLPSGLEKMILVLGSEGTGMTEQIRKKCDFFMRVGPENPKIDSLNVSVAAALGLQALIT